MTRPSEGAKTRSSAGESGAWKHLRERLRRGNERRSKTILAIDGGGIRGIIPALVLADLEERTGRGVAECFDLIAGTSTGGIIALALTVPDENGHPRWRARDLVELYERQGSRIFSHELRKSLRGLGGMIHEKYEAVELERIVAEYCGEARLSQAVTEVLITAYEVVARRPHFFDSAKARSDPAADFTMRHVARATSAAPTYFEPHNIARTGELDPLVLVDGGVYANNPAMCAWVEAERQGIDGDVLLVSLGTGHLTRPFLYQDIRHWGLAQWARPMLDVVFDGVSKTIDYQLSELLGSDRYWRLQPTLTVARDDLDDVRPENIRALRGHAEQMIAERAADLDAIAAILAR
ncbi:MAG: patatin-like phospholipase family protein [Actinomycetota bacterium]|nr:patatin-like phospholipase family protein [Actinomycetota bacterium]